MIASARQWVERHQLPILCGLVVVAAVTRIALVFGSAKPYGYVWDFYHEGVILTYEHARLPAPNDCWECHQPPLFFAAGVPFYALGMAASKGDAAGGLQMLSLLPMICALFVVFFCCKTLRLLRPSRGMLLLGTALALVFPCLFISSYGAENDVLLAAFMSAFFYRLCLYQLRPGNSSWREPLLMGILAGLSALTKYPGLLTLIAAAIVMSLRLSSGRGLRTARDLLIIITAAFAICGGHYIRNVRMTGKPFLGPPGYPDTLATDVGKVRHDWRRYDFLSFKIKEVVDLYRPENTGTLNDFPVYSSVFTTLHALAWTDMSFFPCQAATAGNCPSATARAAGVFSSSPEHQRARPVSRPIPQSTSVSGSSTLSFALGSSPLFSPP